MASNTLAHAPAGSNVRDWRRDAQNDLEIAWDAVTTACELDSADWPHASALLGLAGDLIVSMRRQVDDPLVKPGEMTTPFINLAALLKGAGAMIEAPAGVRALLAVSIARLDGSIDYLDEAAAHHG